MRATGFDLEEVIYAAGETVVAKATHEGARVVLKFHDNPRPAPELLARWRHEYATLTTIRSPLVVRALALKESERGLVLVLENFESINLAQLIARDQLDLADRLSLAISLARGIGAVHEHQFIHGDIAPKNVLVNPASLDLKICDFGLASRIDVQPRRSDGTMMVGTLEYMSPEQTGRTNLDVDYRSDFYSLGATLYELFAGRVPFLAQDPMSLLHAQLASLPVPLHELDTTIPEPLSAIVQKLLAKHPDDRYQSSFGLIQDLETCAESWRKSGRIERFSLARHDVPEHFCIAQKLYGRQDECARVLSAFKRAVANASVEFLLIGGYSGIGKTALVNELHRPVLSRRGYLLRGKCDQYNHNQPYIALRQAFGQMLQTLLQEGAERRQFWKVRLTDALGANLAAISDIVPELSQLVGKPLPLPPLPAAESEQRFHIAFAQFVLALSPRSHPLLLFLDDLQWADVPTLRLLEHLARSDGEQSVLLVGAYRDNEVNAGDPLDITLRAIERTMRIDRLHLGALTSGDVRQLIADTLHSTPESVAELSDLCVEKTRGNPFFLSQFLRSLYELGDICYDRGKGAWNWNLPRIRQRGMTDNVVDLLLTKLGSLPDETQDLLARAAHLGSRFDQRDLMAIGQCDAPTVAERLWPALQAGLVMPLNDDYKYAQSPERLQDARYRFLHDRVQQAAHELVSEDKRAELRLHCGRSLLATSNELELEARLFVILESLNDAIELIVDGAERRQLLELNLRGGIRAKASSAFAAAFTMLSHAARLLPTDAWQSMPETALQVHRHRAEAEYLSGDFDRAEERLAALIAQAPGVAAKVTLCLTQVEQMHIRGHFSAAFDVLCDALALLGHDFPRTEEAAGACFTTEFIAIDARLENLTEADLVARPEMTDSERLLEMQLYFGLAYATYQINRGLSYVLGACRMVRTTLDHGNCDLSSIAYVTYETAMAAMGKPYPAVFAMGKLARRLAELRDNPYFRLSVYQYFAAFYQHWCDPLRDTLAHLELGLDMGRAGINPLAAGYCALLRPVNAFIAGQSLEDVEMEAQQGLAFLQRSRQPATEVMLRCAVLQPIAAMRGRSVAIQSFDTADVRIGTLLADDLTTPSIGLAFYAFAMTRHAYIFDLPNEWRSASVRLAMIGALLPDSPALVEASFFRALGLLRFDAGNDGALEEVEALLGKFESWATHCPANFEHKALMIRGELMRVHGDAQGAMDVFARAIDAAGESGFAHMEALSNELYALYWQANQQRQLAGNFIREAYYHYQRWGASAKCRQIEARWPHMLFRAVELRRFSAGSTGSYGAISSSVGTLDLHSLLKASRSLSQEVNIESLLQKLLGIVLENAGAEFGAIISCDEEALVVEALGQFGEGRMTEYSRLCRSISDLRNEPPQLPLELIEHAHLTRSLLVLNNPVDDVRFSASAYFELRKPKSALVLPVLIQSRLIGLLYAENGLLEGAFTERHVKTLELLGAQAAISLVNARHVEQLERKVAERTDELRRMSMKDGLTGIANRRSFDERLAGEWRRAQRTGKPVSLMMIDIDHFKLYNDHYGHIEGDRCIRAVAQSLEGVINRGTDLVARYGGEEFAAILPDTDRDAAGWLAAACIRAIGDLALPHAKSGAGPFVSVSIGTHTAIAEGDSESLLSQADRALYDAKRGGRNCWRAFTP